MDGDGKPDLVAANTGSNVISFYKNTSTPGTISFNARIDFTVGTNPYSVAIKDLDGDGKPDLAITTQGSSSALSVMANTTTGGIASFNAPIDYATLAGSFIVSPGDLDGDGKPDLGAASSSSNSVTVLKNTSTPGNISFTLQQNFTTGNYPVCVSLSDLDGDGKPDIATSNRFSNDVSALRNIGTTSAINFDSHVDYRADTDPFYVAVGDLDGDGRPDILSANSASTTISIFRNIIGANITPTISSFTPTSGIGGTTVKIIGSNFTGATSVKFGGVEASSFTVDSASGITAIVGAGASGDISVTTANGTATLAGFTFNGPVITSFTPTIGIDGTVVTITGLNFTGVTDIKFGGTPAASFTVNSSTNISATVGAGSAGSVTVTTANGTAEKTGFAFGVPTIISFAPASGSVGSSVTITGTNFSPVSSDDIVFFGAVKATVTSGTSTQLNVIVPAGSTYDPITVTTNNLTAYSSRPFIVTFQSDSTLLTNNSFSTVGNYATGTYPGSVSISDLNDDGKPDMVMANNVSNNISILKNTGSEGTISFDVKTDYNTGPDPKQIAIGDLDGDGKPDIVVTNFNSGNASLISIFRNTSTAGIISFASKADYTTGNGTLGIAVADMNGDGKPDIVVSSGNSGIFSIFFNTTITPGPVSFSSKQDYTLFGHGDNITVADLDKDGRPDLVTSNFSDGTISIFKNTSAGGVFSLNQKIDYPVGINPIYVTTGDLDADGMLDLIVTNYTSGTVSLFKNVSGSGNISFTSINNYALGASNISVNDLNGDGKPDLFTGTGISGIASVIENISTENGNFSFAPHVDFTTGNYDTHVSVDDLDGDGKPDLVVTNALLNTVTILNNKIGEPVIESLSATSAKRGATVTINGSNFNGATAVSFGGTPAVSFKVISTKQIDAVIGGGASGDITVTTPAGTGTITGFKFTPQISAGGLLTFCEGGTVKLASSASANNQWYKDGVAISGATANTLQVNTGGTYTVYVTSNGITTSSDTGIAVTVTSVSTPVISKDNNNLISTAATGNQWYFNEAIIPGATAQTYQSKQSGSYSVRNTLNDCTSDFSLPYTFALTGTINLGNGEYINLYPNPVKDKLYINWNITGMPSLDVQVSDFQGKPVLLNKNIHTPALINLSSLPQGIYFIKIFNIQLNISNTIKIIKED